MLLFYFKNGGKDCLRIINFTCLYVSVVIFLVIAARLSS
jgi:hypothetical protein